MALISKQTYFLFQLSKCKSWSRKKIEIFSHLTDFGEYSRFNITKLTRSQQACLDLSWPSVEVISGALSAEIDQLWPCFLLYLALDEH